MRISLVLGKGPNGVPVPLSRGTCLNEKGYDALSCFPNSRSTTPSHQPHVEIDATALGWADNFQHQRREEINSVSMSPLRKGPKCVSAEHKCECDTRSSNRPGLVSLPATREQRRLPTNRETLRTLTADVSGPMRSHSSGSGISRQVSIRPSIHLISSKSHLISSRRKSEGRACRWQFMRRLINLLAPCARGARAPPSLPSVSTPAPNHGPVAGSYWNSISDPDLTPVSCVVSCPERVWCVHYPPKILVSGTRQGLSASLI